MLRGKTVHAVTFELDRILFTLFDGYEITEKIERDEQLPMICLPVNGLCAEVTANKTSITRELTHLRQMHIHSKNMPIKNPCMGCTMGRGTTKRGKKVRSEDKVSKHINHRVAADFVGPWPKSHMNNTQLFVITDEYDRWIETYATSSRSCCGEFLDKWVKDVGRMTIIRTDNAKEFKEGDAHLRNSAEKWKDSSGNPIKVEHGPPYSPWANGLAERSNRTVIETVRSSIMGCDSRCWDFAATAAAHVINRVLVRKWKPPGSKVPKVNRTAYETRFSSKPAVGYLRRWGCLCFIKEETPESKTSPRKIPAMFVGYARNGCWKVLLWRTDARCKTGRRLAIEETKQVAFDESILVKDVHSLIKLADQNIGTWDLDPGVNRKISSVFHGNQILKFEEFVPSSTIETAEKEFEKQERHNFTRIDELTRGVMDKDQDATDRKIIQSVLGSDDVTQPSEGVKPSEGVLPSEGVMFEDSEFSPEKDLTDKEILDYIREADDLSGNIKQESKDGIVVMKKSRGRPRKIKTVNQSDESTEAKPFIPTDGEAAPKRSRPKGGKNKVSTSSKKDVKLPLIVQNGLSKTQKRNAKRKCARANRALLEAQLDVNVLDSDLEFSGLEEGEEVENIEIKLIHKDTIGDCSSVHWVEACVPILEQAVASAASVKKKEALYGPDSAKYRAAMTKERLGLESLDCWRDMTPEELADKSVQTIPTALVFTRKRPCAEFPERKYKCRLVVLGNLQRLDEDKSVFAPVASYPAARAFLIEGAAKGLVPIQFDIRNAFIQSVLKEKINVRLPEEWGAHKVRLIRALYGLRISPVTWYKTFRTGLLELGWIECVREPGTFMKGHTRLIVYVDDCLIMAETQEEALAETKTILSRFEGNVVPPVKVVDDQVEMDFLGMLVLFNSKEKTLKIVATKAIERMMKKFQFQINARKISLPAVKEDLTTTEQELSSLKEKPSNFPLRSLIGGLNYVSQTARPDIAFSVNRVARYQSSPTPRVIEAAKRILRYLLSTASEGLEYSPAREQRFNAVFKEIAEQGDRLSKYSNVVQFSDADYAGCATTVKSTSGSIHYLRGVPVCWHSRRQGLRAESTCEAELYASHDAIKCTRSQGWLEWFNENPLLFVDNMSLIDVCKQEFTSKKSKHIGIRYLSVRDKLSEICFVRTQFNLADGLTKPMHTLNILNPTNEDCDVYRAEVFLYLH